MNECLALHIQSIDLTSLCIHYPNPTEAEASAAAAEREAAAARLREELEKERAPAKAMTSYEEVCGWNGWALLPCY
jgi:hypothetical protein